MFGEIHNDDVLYDPLPQPYRFLNKLLIKTFEDAVDLAEGGGAAEIRNAYISHNLRLTKVGKIPTKVHDQFILSSTISQNEISCYQLLANTNLLVIGTSNGNILIYDPSTDQVVYNLSITTLSKFAQAHPISILCTFETDFNNYIIAFATEEVSYLLLISNTFVLKSSNELDISSFIFETLEFRTCDQPFLSITDGTGRTTIYNCHTPSELTSDNAVPSTKNQGTKSMSLEPVFEVEKCPISTGPVSSEAIAPPKAEDPNAKKK